MGFGFRIVCYKEAQRKRSEIKIVGEGDKSRQVPKQNA